MVRQPYQVIDDMFARLVPSNEPESHCNDLNRETAMADKQRRFTDDFKREAIRLVDSRGRGIERTARDLGISKSSLTRWMSERREIDLLSGPHDDMQKELARLRRENELLRAERDLLKKAAAFFARETSR
jgi:transposase